ncbi:MAG: DUF1080 domain-containing protein, partial [Clostridia bacterium]|nr:DUF1080 domain-containing protein [Clostridia bacterium]
MKKIAWLLLCSLIGGVCFYGMACKAKNEQPKELADKNLYFVEDDWIEQAGDWEFSDRILTQKQNGNANRILLDEVIDQNYLNVSVDIRFDDNASEAGIEFRADYTYNSKERLCVAIDNKNSKVGAYLQSGSRVAADKRKHTVMRGRWYRLRVELSGVSANYYIDEQLFLTRNDVSLKEDSAYICLYSNGSNVSFRNFEYSTSINDSYTWKNLVSSSDITKSGWERFNANKFEYPYVGLGRTTLLVGPYGFLSPEANRPGIQSYQYKNDPALIYDYWWDDAIKVTPFSFSGGYLKNGRVRNGEVTEDERTAYYQSTDVETGLLTTALTLDVDGDYVETLREMIVDKNGVVAYKITNKTKLDFVFEVETEAGFHAKYTELKDGLIVESNLRKDTENKGYLAVKAVSSKGINVDAENGKITFKATDKPIYIYLSPSSTLNEGENAKNG